MLKTYSRDAKAFVGHAGAGTALNSSFGQLISPFHPVTLKNCSQMADYASAMAPVSTNALLWPGESDYALAMFRAFLKHARKPFSHDQQ
jgi:hypothetical protein